MAATSTLTRPGPGKAGSDASEGGDGEKQPKSKKKLIIILVAVLLVGGVGYLKFGKKSTKSAAAAANGPITTLDPVTINLADGHLLQVGVAVQMTTYADKKKLATDTPKMTDAVISVFSAWTYSNLLGEAGHDRARAEVVAKLQTVFPPIKGHAEVAGIYYTTFVMQ
ncbi:MAG TPA: flagellar basal body-associated FliL family protein [Acidimicrobiales bacterium]|nr:flagellar basal body-associated FliL family protein [Acidimicrobiales bacterium]